MTLPVPGAVHGSKVEAAMGSPIVALEARGSSLAAALSSFLEDSHAVPSPPGFVHFSAVINHIPLN
jgi:hypothetical protein